MLISELAKQFHLDGYLHIPGFYSDNIMGLMHTEIETHFGDDPQMWHSDEFVSKSRVEVVPWFPKEHGVKVFDLVDSDSRLKALTTAILGEGWKDLYCMVMFSKAGSQGQAWHQDCLPEKMTQFNLNRLVYSESISKEVGGEVVIMPGSHRKGRIPVGDTHEEMVDQKFLRPSKGDLVLLHGQIWHRITPVNTHHRVSTNYRVVPRNTPLNVTDICVYRNMLYDFSTNQMIEERTV